MDNNFEIAMDCINSLKRSQGMYSRIASALSSDKKLKNEFKKQVNSLPQFKDCVDFILWLEG